MTVSDDQVAAMRAYLSGNQDEFRRLNGSLDRSKEGLRTYGCFITGAFFEAVSLRFTERTTRNEVIDYVADLRSRSDNVAEELDPEKAERMIMMVISDDDVDDLSSSERIGLEMILIAGLVTDAGLDAAGLETFLEKARAFGNALLA